VSTGRVGSEIYVDFTGVQKWAQSQPSYMR
jgi:hypothetical protein